MFITRVNSSGGKCMARPCPNCQKNLKREGFLPKNIFYTSNAGVWTCLEKWDEV